MAPTWLTGLRAEREIACSPDAEPKEKNIEL